MSATPGRVFSLEALTGGSSLAALPSLEAVTVGRAARDPSGLPNKMRLTGVVGLITVDLPTPTCTTGAMSTRPQGAVGNTGVTTRATGCGCGSGAARVAAGGAAGLAVPERCSGRAHSLGRRRGSPVRRRFVPTRLKQQVWVESWCFSSLRRWLDQSGSIVLKAFHRLAGAADDFNAFTRW